MAEWIFTSKPKLFGLVGGWANPTGIALIVILVVMTVCSLPFVRRGGCFEVIEKKKKKKRLNEEKFNANF